MSQNMAYNCWDSFLKIVNIFKISFLKDSTDFPPFANASNTNCHWMVSSDSCDGSESKYRVNVRTGIIDDKVIVNNVVIRYLKNMYVIGDDLKVSV